MLKFNESSFRMPYLFDEFNGVVEHGFEEIEKTFFLKPIFARLTLLKLKKLKTIE